MQQLTEHVDPVLEAVNTWSNEKILTYIKEMRKIIHMIVLTIILITSQ